MMLPLRLSRLALESLGIQLSKLSRDLISLLGKTEFEEFNSRYLNPTCKYIENMISNLPPFFANDICGTLVNYILNASYEFEKECLSVGECSMRIFVLGLDVFLKILLSVTHSDMTKLDIFFGQQQTKQYCNFLTSYLNIALQKMKAIKSLHLQVVMPRDVPVFKNVKNLSKLEEFTFNGCSDDDLKNLFSMGAQLSKLDVRGSFSITDNSIDHILKFKSLKYLNVRQTCISEKGLMKLMEGMKELSRTTYWDMDTEPSSALKVFKSSFLEQHTALLPDCFPNLVYVEIHLGNPVTLTALKQLKNLKMLAVCCNINPRYRFQVILEELLNEIGKQLLELTLENVENISLKHIAETASSLQKLCLTHCISIPRLLCGGDVQANVFPEFPSVSYFKLGIINGPEDLLQYIISRFVNLKIVALYIPQVLPIANFLHYLVQTMKLGKFEALEIGGNRFEVCGQLLLFSKVSGPSLIINVQDFEQLCHAMLTGDMEYENRGPDRYKYIDILT
ncbi:hypothetical protein C0J52_27723 [Blattella germanica]|nr:hypothetical protein C0J52_27723 [Blattella germanica]